MGFCVGEGGGVCVWGEEGEGEVRGGEGGLCSEGLGMELRWML